MAAPGIAIEPGSGIPDVPCLIGGTWVQGEGPVKDTINPATGEVVTRVAFASEAQVDAAVAAAKAAQEAWGALSVAERVEIIAKGIDEIEKGYELISRWAVLEMGKTITEAREEMFDLTVGVGRSTLEDALRFGGRTLPAYNALHADRRAMTIYQPIGVSAFIAPWNFPVDMLVNCIGSLAMGNTVLWKPSEWAPFAPTVAAEMLVSALPEGVFNLVHGGGELGEYIVRHPDVGMIGFIGSTVVGEKISRAAGVKRLLLELGGNGPLIVLDDADVDGAVDAAMTSCFYQAGQVCTSAERILVHEAVHDEFVSKLVARAKVLKVGDPMDESTEMGPISDERIMAKVVRHVDSAVAEGATVLTGGSRDGMFYPPTVLVDVKPGMEIADEETFGPVAPIIKVSSAEEALAIANDSQYGLSMAVWTQSLKTAFEMAEGLQAGAVNVNAGTSDWEINGPFGGFKQSGVGRELGEDGLRAFTNVKTISIHPR